MEDNRVLSDYDIQEEDTLYLQISAPLATYLAYNSSTGLVDTEREVWVGNVIDEATDAFVTGWNLVEGDVKFGSRIVLAGFTFGSLSSMLYALCGVVLSFLVMWQKTALLFACRG